MTAALPDLLSEPDAARRLVQRLNRQGRQPLGLGLALVCRQRHDGNAAAPNRSARATLAKAEPSHDQ